MKPRVQRWHQVIVLEVTSKSTIWVIWEFFLIRCEVLGQGCLCVQIVTHSETHLYFVKLGDTNKLNIFSLMSQVKSQVKIQIKIQVNIQVKKGKSQVGPPLKTGISQVKAQVKFKVKTGKSQVKTNINILVVCSSWSSCTFEICWCSLGRKSFTSR